MMVEQAAAEIVREEDYFDSLQARLHAGERSAELKAELRAQASRLAALRRATPMADFRARAMRREAVR